MLQNDRRILMQAQRSLSVSPTLLVVRDAALAPAQRLDCRGLASQNFQAVTVDSVDEARRRLAADQLDVVVFDLPRVDDEAARLIRDVAGRQHLAVMVVSSPDDEAGRIRALEAGADHCLIRPLGLPELAAHLRAVWRRAVRQGARPARRTQAMLGGWTIDLAARCARSSARVVDLTPGETAILRVLLERPGRVCSRAELLASTRRGDTELFERTVDVLIARLRRKLELDGRTPPLIHTVGEEGYRLTPGVTSSAR